MDQLARAIGKSRSYVEDRVAAVETVRTIRRGSKKSTIAVMQSPTREERKEGVLPIKHAAFLHRAEEAPLVQKLPEEKREGNCPRWPKRSPGSPDARPRRSWSASSGPRRGPSRR